MGVNLRSWGFMPVWPLASMLFAKGRDQFVSLTDGIDVLVADERLRKEWRSLHALLVKIRSQATPILGYQPRIEKVAFFRYRHGATPWETDDTDAVRLHICVVPSPTLWAFAASEAVVPMYGQVLWLNEALLHSWVNFGEEPGIILSIELARPGKADDAED